MSGEQERVPILEMDVEGYRKQLERLQAVRRTRDNRAVRQSLTALKSAARDENCNLMPLLLAVSAYATRQEMMDVFRDVWGEYEEPVNW